MKWLGEGDISANQAVGRDTRKAMQHQTLKLKNDIHLSRKLWHCVGISAMAVAYNLLGHSNSWIVLGLVSALIIPLDIWRKSWPELNRFVLKVMGPLMRRHESHAVSGMSYLLLGSMFLLLLGDAHLITLTLLFLAFGDPLASFCGLRFGKDRLIGQKTLQGTMAAFAVCTVIAGFYYYFNNLMTERLFIVTPLSGLIGAAAEVLPIGKLDDNLTFPIISACLLWILFKVYGGFAV